MRKNYGIIGFIAIFAIAFCIPWVCLVGNFFSHFSYLGILSGGTEVEAVVIIDSEITNVSVNDVSYYSFAFRFVDQNGDEHMGRTSMSFTISEVGLWEKVGTITIKYNPQTFEAVESSYSLSASEGTKTMFILFLVLFAIDAIFWIIIIVMIVKAIKKNKISKTGKQYTANFESYSTNVKVNGVSMYSIKYNWQNEYGNTIQGKSGSDYTLLEAMAFGSMGTFLIKADGDDSVIVTSPNVKKQLMQDWNKLPKDSVRCKYCCRVYNNTYDRCPSCGAPRSVD